MNTDTKQLIKWSALAAVVVVSSGCANFMLRTPSLSDFRYYTLTEDEKRDIKCKVILTSGISEQKLPVDNLTEYSLDSGTSLFQFIRLFNLYRSEYFICVNLYAEDGKLFDQFSSVIKPEKMRCDVFFFGKYFSPIVKAGNIKMEIKLNNVKIDESVILFKRNRA